MLKFVGWAVGIVPFSASRGYQLGRRVSGKYDEDDGDSAAANHQEGYELRQCTRKHRNPFGIDYVDRHFAERRPSANLARTRKPPL